MAAIQIIIETLTAEKAEGRCTRWEQFPKPGYFAGFTTSRNSRFYMLIESVSPDPDDPEALKVSMSPASGDPDTRIQESRLLTAAEFFREQKANPSPKIPMVFQGVPLDLDDCGRVVYLKGSAEMRPVYEIILRSLQAAGFPMLVVDPLGLSLETAGMQKVTLGLDTALSIQDIGANYFVEWVIANLPAPVQAEAARFMLGLVPPTADFLPIQYFAYHPALKDHPLASAILHELYDFHQYRLFASNPAQALPLDALRQRLQIDFSSLPARQLPRAYEGILRMIARQKLSAETHILLFAPEVEPHHAIPFLQGSPHRLFLISQSSQPWQEFLSDTWESGCFSGEEGIRITGSITDGIRLFLPSHSPSDPILQQPVVSAIPDEASIPRQTVAESLLDEEYTGPSQVQGLDNEYGTGLGEVFEDETLGNSADEPEEEIDIPLICGEESVPDAYFAFPTPAFTTECCPDCSSEEETLPALPAEEEEPDDPQEPFLLPPDFVLVSDASDSGNGCAEDSCTEPFLNPPPDLSEHPEEEPMLDLDYFLRKENLAHFNPEDFEAEEPPDNPAEDVAIAESGPMFAYPGSLSEEEAAESPEQSNPIDPLAPPLPTNAPISKTITFHPQDFLKPENPRRLYLPFVGEISDILGGLPAIPFIPGGELPAGCLYSPADAAVKDSSLEAAVSHLVDALQVDKAGSDLTAEDLEREIKEQVERLENIKTADASRGGLENQEALEYLQSLISSASPTADVTADVAFEAEHETDSEAADVYPVLEVSPDSEEPYSSDGDLPEPADESDRLPLDMPVFVLDEGNILDPSPPPQLPEEKAVIQPPEETDLRFDITEPVAQPVISFEEEPSAASSDYSESPDLPMESEFLDLSDWSELPPEADPPAAMESLPLPHPEETTALVMKEEENHHASLVEQEDEFPASEAASEEKPALAATVDSLEEELLEFTFSEELSLLPEPSNQMAMSPVTGSDPLDLIFGEENEPGNLADMSHEFDFQRAEPVQSIHIPPDEGEMLILPSELPSELDFNLDIQEEVPQSAPLHSVSPEETPLPVFQKQKPSSEPEKDASPLFQAGEQVFHQRYGQGIIKRVILMEGDQLILNISFEGIGKRLLDPRLTQLEKVS